MIKQRLMLEVAGSKLAYTLFQKKASETNIAQQAKKKSLLLLHGAGVAGELTWTFIVNYLEHWDEILVPDLLGMGDSFFDLEDRQGFSIEDICKTLFSLLHHHQWSDFDLAGYSLGGLMALELNKESPPDFTINKMCLIEPALFSDQSLQAALLFRNAFTPISANIKSDPDNPQHFLDFLNLVSPKRKRSDQIDSMAVQRLQQRPYGFANALAAVSEYAKHLDEPKLQALLKAIPPGVGIVGGLSSPGLFQAQKKIREVQPAWQIETIANIDHSLVYVRPKAVAQLFNQHLI
ncbi:MAG: alpha/beta hydrolase [Oleispira sp.]|nr:alpha/beta hydrolase [Oleispira sp.]